MITGNVDYRRHPSLRMVGGRLGDYRNRVRTELEAAFEEDTPPHDVAGSFAIGIFITSLPTLGAGLLVFVLLVAIFDRISKLALFASVIVLNPVVKWGVYGASFWIGTRILGPAPGVTPSNISFSAGPEVVSRLLVGNLILSAVFTVCSYLIVLRLVRSFRAREIEIDDVIGIE